jgi:probable O-glycosylation ligase (exosortase A-associated)
MPIRDLVLFAIAAGAIPFILRHPWMGVLFSAWFGLMSPHRLTWGPAYDFRFVLWLAVLTLIGMLVTRDERRWKAGVEVYLLIGFIAWYSLTTVFAFNPDRALPALERAVKIQVLVFLTLILFNSKRQLELLVWTIGLSIGFYGLKGGLYTLRTGADVGRVWGPAGSFIEDNNAVGLALVLAIPYLYYLFGETQNRWVKVGLLGVMGTSVVAAVGTYSRGTFLAILAMGFWLWWKSRHKLLFGFALVLTVPLLLAFLPGKWEDRMRSITEYQQDSSAMGRINAWQTAIGVARDHPLVGGGFEFHSRAVFARYAPVPEDVHAMHSIYFQVLGEHGFVGLALFLAIWFFSWRRSARLAKATKGRDDLRWASNLVAMVQVSMVGYLVGGAFLNLAYWDLPYFGLAILIITGDIVRRAAAAPAGEAAPAGQQAPRDATLRPAPGPAGPSAVSSDRLDSRP